MIEFYLSSRFLKFKDRYGFHLPYILLKKLKMIKKVNIEKLMDKNYNISEVITVQISDYL